MWERASNLAESLRTRRLPAVEVMGETSDRLDAVNPTYVDWGTASCAVSVTELPAISVRAGFTSTGFPVGSQIVGKPRGDLKSPRMADAFEQATQHRPRRPSVHG